MYVTSQFSCGAPSLTVTISQVKTQIEVQRELLELEMKSPLWTLLPTNTTVTKFLAMALKIEDAQ